jgi:putative effector of murein hydrolase
VLHAWAGVFVLFGIDRSLSKFFTLSRIRFPSSLAGMLALFLLLQVADQIRARPRGLVADDQETSMTASLPRSAASVTVSLASPGLGLITRWLAIFFVPNLIMLPVAAVPRGMALLRLVVAIGLGLVVSLVSTLLFVSLFEWASRVEKAGYRQERSRGSDAVQGPTPKAAPASAEPIRLQQREISKPMSTSKAPTGPRFALITVWGIIWITTTLGWIFGAGIVANGRALMLWLSLLSSSVVGFSLGQRLPPRIQKVLHPLVTCVMFTYFSIFLLAKGSGSAWIDILLLYMRRPGKQWPPSVNGVASAAAASAIFALGGPGNLLLSFLGPAVLSFAFQMYQRRRLIQENAPQVLGGCLLAAFFGMLGSAVLARMLCLPAALRLVFVPRSITAPLAIAMADMLECDATLTATIVVITGLLGANFGRLFLDLLRPLLPRASAPVARGLAMGASAHGLGTAAISEEPEAFPFAAIAMALVGTLSALMVTLPAFRTLLGVIAGVPVP